MSRAAQDPLKTYKAKRDFRKTREPLGAKRRARGKPIFVVQKHDASRLHYDFRIEVDGILKSWAIPKGPSMDPREKRLAVPTEDHPMGYAGFEGTIPEGQYGGGTVMVWDTGTYTSLKTGDDGNEVPISEQLAKGHATIRLEGHKLKGGFALIRAGRIGGPGWLLVKMADANARPGYDITSSEPDSTASGRSIEEIREAD